MQGHVGGSRLHRREWRDGAWQVAAEDIEAIQAKDYDIFEKAIGAAEEAVQVYIDTREPILKAAVEIAADDGWDDIAKEVYNKMDSDCDLYICTYWDNFKVSEAQKAINYIEESLKKNFEKNKVKSLRSSF